MMFSSEIGRVNNDVLTYPIISVLNNEHHKNKINFEKRKKNLNLNCFNVFKIMKVKNKLNLLKDFIKSYNSDFEFNIILKRVRNRKNNSFFYKLYVYNKFNEVLEYIESVIGIKVYKYYKSNSKAKAEILLSALNNLKIVTWNINRMNWKYEEIKIFLNRNFSRDWKNGRLL